MKVETTGTTEPACVDMPCVARLLGVSLGSINRWKALGRLPKPMPGLGRTVRYRRTEILAWIEAGCPDQKTWEKMKAQAK